MPNNGQSLYFDSGIDADKFYAELNKMQAQLGQLVTATEKHGSQMDSVFKKVAGAVGGYFSLQMFGQATKALYNFSSDYETAMIEVGTISDEVFGKFPEYKQQILNLSTEGAQAPKDLANAFYQIVSAGYDGAEGLAVLEAASKSATAGFVETETAADGITTVLNAWGKPFTEATNVADVFFKTVEKGKTTFPELATYVAQFAPIASTLKIPFEEVMSLMATITKQGTPTAQAATQVRAALSGIAREFGDTIFEGRSLQETFEFIAKTSNYSIGELTKNVGQIEGANAILATTGEKLSMAFEDLDAIANNSIGSTEKALLRVEETSADVTAKLRNNILAALAPLGEGMVEKVAEIGKSLNEAFENGTIEEFFNDFAKALKVGAALLVVYNAKTIATTTSMLAQEGALRVLIVREEVINRWRKISAATQAAYNASMAAGTGVIGGVSSALKALWATMAMNPLTAVVAVLGLATAAFFAFRKEIKSAADIQEEFDRLQKKSKDYEENLKPLIDRYNELKENQNKTNEEQTEFNGLIQTLADKIPSAIGEMDKYGNVISLVGDKLKEFSATQDQAIKLQAEQGLKDAQDALDDLTLKLKVAKAGMSETYTQVMTGSAGGYGGTVTKTRSGEARAKAAKEFQEVQAEIDKVTEAVAAYQKTLSDINNRAFYEENKNLFKDLSGLADEELNDISMKLSELYDIAPDDFVREKIISQIEKVYAESDKRMEELSKESSKKTTTVEFKIDDFKKSLKEKEELYAQYFNTALQFGEDYANKQFANLLKEGKDYEEFLKAKLHAYRNNNEAIVAIGEAATANDIMLNPPEQFSNALQAKKGVLPDLINTEDVLKDVNATMQKTLIKSLDQAGDLVKKMNNELASDDITAALDTGWQISDALGQAANAAGQVNEDMGEAMTAVAEIANNTMNIVTGLATGNYVQAAAAGFQMVMDMMARRQKEAAEAAEAQLKSLNQIIEAQNKQLDIYTERMRNASGEERYNQEKATLELLQQQSDELMSQVSETELLFKGKQKVTKDGWLWDSSFTGNLDSSVKFEDFKALEDFILNGDLQKILNGEVGLKGDVNFAKTFESMLSNPDMYLGLGGNLINWGDMKLGDVKWSAENMDALYELYDKIKEVEEKRRELMEQLTGTTTNSIADSIVQGFAEGKTAIEDFASSFEDMMKEALMNNFKNQFVMKEAEKFFQSFGSAAQDGYTADELAALKEQWAQSISGLSEQFKAYEELSQGVFGEDIFSGSEKDGISGQIKASITEETATELAGLWTRTSFDIRRQLEILEGANNLLAMIQANTNRTADNTEKLDSIDRNIDKIANSSSNDRAYGNIG